MNVYDNKDMNKLKRTTANLPEDLIEAAMKVTKKNITDTLIEGLRLLKRTAAFEKAQKLRGKLQLDIDLDVSRERTRR